MASGWLWLNLVVSGLHLSREMAWWFCALKCQDRGLLCCCGVMAEQRAEQRGLPSSQSLAENSRAFLGWQRQAFPSCQPAQSRRPRIRISVSLPQHLSCLESERHVPCFLLPEAVQVANRIYRQCVIDRPQASHTSARDCGATRLCTLKAHCPLTLSLIMWGDWQTRRGEHIVSVLFRIL